MSEGLAGVTWTPPPAAIRPAAAVVLVRPGGNGEREVFWVRRGAKLTFSGGFHAFPGGQVDPGDGALPIEGSPDDERAFRAAAIRETFEEAGVLLARGAERLGSGARRALRRELLEGKPFAELVARAGLVLDGAALVPAGRWRTPPFSAVRFDARFFLAVVPAGTEAEVLPGELAEGGWIRPREALALWEDGRVLLHPPNHHALATLAGFPPESAVWRLRNPPFLDADGVVERIEFQRGFLMFPMRTPTLPPARHTHCWIVGTGELILVDPGSPEREEQDRLEALVRALVAEGRRPKCVLLTHHHADHTGAALAIGRRLGVPVRASAETARRVAGVEGDLADGDAIALDGPRPMTLRAFLTEGHARGHLVFRDEASGATLAGDMVAGGSTIVIDPPEGDLRTYLDSLRRMRALPVGTLYPAHGYAIRDGIAKIDEYLAHREERLEQIRKALGAGPRTVAALVREVYVETPAWLHPAAERSAHASLLELERRGQARRAGEDWRAA